MRSMLAVVADWITVDRLNLIIAFVFGAFGVFGVFYGWRGHQLSKEMHTDAQQPMVVVTALPAEHDRNIIVLRIENIGPSVATDVKISATPPLQRSFDREDAIPMHAWHVFTEGIPALPPRAKLEYLFDIGNHRFSSDLPRRYRFVVDANGPVGKVKTLTYDVDLDPMQDLWIGQTTMSSVVKAVDGVAGGLQKLSLEVNLFANIVVDRLSERRLTDDATYTPDAEMLASLADLSTTLDDAVVPTSEESQSTQS